MKRIVTNATLALLLSALPAQATGIGLRWGSCQGTSNRSFACDRSAGSELLVASFSPPSGISELTGIEAYLRITTANGSIPAWWQVFNAGSCRRSSMSISLDVSDQMECDDPWEGQAMGGIARYKIGGAEGVDLLLGVAIPTTARHALSSSSTYAAFKLVINHQRTTGADACAGCETPVCITLERLVIAQYAPQDPVTHVSRPRYIEVAVGLPSTGTTPGNVVTWQGGTPNCSQGRSKPSSWSQIKDRFRPYR